MTSKTSSEAWGTQAQGVCYLPATVKRSAGPEWDFYELLVIQGSFQAMYGHVPLPRLQAASRLPLKPAWSLPPHSQPLWEDSQSFRSHTLIHHSPRWTQNLPKHLPCPTRHQLWLYLSSDLKGTVVPGANQNSTEEHALSQSSLRWDAWRILCKVTANRHLLPVFIDPIS